MTPKIIHRTFLKHFQQSENEKVSTMVSPIGKSTKTRLLLFKCVSNYVVFISFRNYLNIQQCMFISGLRKLFFFTNHNNLTYFHTIAKVHTSQRMFIIFD